MTNDIKKETIKKILASIQDSAFRLLDDGVDNHPMDLVMELTITAYELDMMLDFSNNMKNVPVNNQPDNVVVFKPKGVD